MQAQQTLQLKTRNEVHSEALEALEKHSGRGTLNIDTGVGKCKIAIDFTKNHSDIKSILITSPRENLKANWSKELSKWGISPQLATSSEYEGEPYGYEGRSFNIQFENIQTCYKWNDRQWDLIIVDEGHLCMTPEYSKLLENNKSKYLITLTATLDIEGKQWKKEIYDRLSPIIYQYLDAEADGIVNQVKVKIIEHILDNNFKVWMGSKDKPFQQGEAKGYDYLSNLIGKGQTEMGLQVKLEQAANPLTPKSDYFTKASDWFWKKNGNQAQMNAARKYLTAVSKRKYFLLNLSSTAAIARALIRKLSADPANKTLVFSELTEQADKICQYTVHSKHDEQTNAKNLDLFNRGVIKTLGSCYSLTLGLNLAECNNAIFESYQSSDTGARQRLGRLHRLPGNEYATLYIIKVKDTQSEKWYNQILQEYGIDETISSRQILYQ